MKRSSIIHHDLISIVDDMPDELAGRFVKILSLLMQNKEVAIDDFALKMALHPFVAQFKRDSEKYENICERNRINGLKGGRPKNPSNPSGFSKTQGNPRKPKKADNDNDNKKEKHIVQNGKAFALFWTEYPVKKNKKKASDIWKRKKLTSKSADIIADVIKRKEIDTSWRDGFIPHPTTYLNGERWDDEIETIKADKTNLYTCGDCFSFQSCMENRKSSDKAKSCFRLPEECIR